MSRATDAAAELARLKGERSGVGRKIVAVDPGTAATGIAVLEDGAPTKLLVVRAKGSNAKARLPEMCQRVHDELAFLLIDQDVDTLALEWQGTRPTDKRPNDILHLAIVLGAALAAQDDHSKLLVPLPSEWKGQTDGDVFDARVRECFPSAGDLLHGVPQHLQHNAIDALGLAAWAVNKRLPWR